MPEASGFRHTLHCQTVQSIKRSDDRRHFVTRLPTEHALNMLISTDVTAARIDFPRYLPQSWEGMSSEMRSPRTGRKSIILSYSRRLRSPRSLSSASSPPSWSWYFPSLPDIFPFLRLTYAMLKSETPAPFLKQPRRNVQQPAFQVADGAHRNVPKDGSTNSDTEADSIPTFAYILSIIRCPCMIVVDYEHTLTHKTLFISLQNFASNDLNRSA